MVEIYPVQTGLVRVKRAQRRRETGGLLPVCVHRTGRRVLVDRTWTAWLPIYAWAIEHPEGVIVVDTGETARTSDPGYFPGWHPYFRSAVKVDVAPEQEIGPQLLKLGLDPNEVRTVILTHFHTDHAGGLHHFPHSEILVSEADYQLAKGFLGKLRGYLPQRWPAWFAPTPIVFRPHAVGPFDRNHPVTEGGDVVVVPTPGHTPNHVSVVVRADEVSYFLAGDTSYTQDLLLGRHQTVSARMRRSPSEPWIPSCNMHSPIPQSTCRPTILSPPSGSGADSSSRRRPDKEAQDEEPDQLGLLVERMGIG